MKYGNSEFGQEISPRPDMSLAYMAGRKKIPYRAKVFRERQAHKMTEWVKR